MVQIKYFGDNRDYFKYDLITAIFQSKLLDSYVFIPMLTKHRDDNQGNRKPLNNGNKSPELYDFLATCNVKSLNHWERWITPFVTHYYTVKPVDEILFHDGSRAEYWQQFAALMNINNALVFLDPDTGIETGRPSYRKKMGPEKYILNEELSNIFIELHLNSLLMIYQHLPNNKHNHIGATRKKLEQVRDVCNISLTCAYREDDLAFIFAAKSKGLFMDLLAFLEKYYKKGNQQYKTIVTLDK